MSALKPCLSRLRQLFLPWQNRILTRRVSQAIRLTRVHRNQIHGHGPAPQPRFTVAVAAAAILALLHGRRLGVQLGDEALLRQIHHIPAPRLGFVGVVTTILDLLRRRLLGVRLGDGAILRQIHHVPLRRLQGSDEIGHLRIDPDQYLPQHKYWAFGPISHM